MLQLFTWVGNVGALGVILLMAAASVSVIVFFVRRGAGRRPGLAARRLRDSPVSRLLVIAVYTVKDFDVLVGYGPGSCAQLAAARHHRRSPWSSAWSRAWSCARRKPEVHARIGLGNEAFQLEKAAESAESAEAAS